MRAARKDGNHARLRKAWRGMGGSWLNIAAESGGEPDALIGWRNADRLIEVKDPEASMSDQQPRPDQVIWHRSWKGRPVAIVKTFGDMFRLFLP
jgi:hypothetical protein